LGGGRLEISIIVADDGFFEIQAVQGDTHFGGDDFDDRIVLFWIEGISGINRTRYFTRF
jgi:molecular chaperone DnaK (HSP70)